MTTGTGNRDGAQDRAAFDRHAREYTDLLEKSIRSSGYPASFFFERKAREVADALGTAGMPDAPLRVLDFGCGIGSLEPFLAAQLPSAVIRGIDVSGESLAVARERCRNLPNVSFHGFDGRTVPFDGPFDVIVVAGVMHHIPPAERPAVAAELRRVLDRHGVLVLFEHNPANPLTRKAVRDCPFDGDAVLVPPAELLRLLRDAAFGGMSVRFLHFFPGALRRLVPLERWLRWLPLGAQYCCVAQARERAS